MYPTGIIFSSLRHIFLLHLILLQTNLIQAASGKWDLLHPNIGISAMHMQLLHTDTVIIFDRTDFGLSNITIPGGRSCLNNSVVDQDCTAHSVEYDVASNAVRPLMVLTNVWCSSGAVTPEGTLVQAGGTAEGSRVVRIFNPCQNHSCDWLEVEGALAQVRWYATSLILGSGRQIIIGGSGQFNYEFYPKLSSEPDVSSYDLPFLAETKDLTEENNLYPFVFLNDDGRLFIFANNRSILFDYKTGTVVRIYPTIPGGDPRNYPSTGSAVLLPLKENAGAEVLVCGGAPRGAFVKAQNGEFVEALNTCGRIRINDPNAQWEMETMPTSRVMGDMVLLPNGDVLIVNGASAGAAGWDYGRNPVLTPVLYRPDNPVGQRFEILSASSTPRMYHSTAILLRDGRVLVGGSNPNSNYNFTGMLFPTDLTLESFSPPYLDLNFAYLRPIIKVPPVSPIGYGQQISIRFTMPVGSLDNNSIVTVTMVAPSFATHSFSMSQRLLVLTHVDLTVVVNDVYEIRVAMPRSSYLAPRGYYLMYVVHQGIPSEGIWVRMD